MELQTDKLLPVATFRPLVKVYFCGVGVGLGWFLFLFKTWFSTSPRFGAGVGVP